MEQLTYERPREKLQYKGASFLTLAELMQLIIGSGMARISGARLAKHVVSLLKDGTVSYKALREIKGLGNAKVCQIMAALEIGKRLANNPLAAHPSFSIMAEAEVIRQDKTARVICYWFDGAQVVIDTKSYPIHKNEHYSVLLKRLFRDAVAVSARSIVIVVYRSMSTTLTLQPVEQGFVDTLKETAALLTIRLNDIYAMNHSAYISWKASS